MKTVKLFFILLLTIALPSYGHAQQVGKRSVNERSGREVDLVVDGDGATKQEAISNALRNAIEQSFGTFVSANTSIVNDELTKDEIVSISTGNIVSYKELSSSQKDNTFSVTLKARVSIDKLVSYAKSHGSTAEYDGQSYLQDLKIKELNKENELKVLQHMTQKLKTILCDMYNYNIHVHNAKKEGDHYKIPVEIALELTDAYKEAVRIQQETIANIALTRDEARELKDSGFDVTQGYFSVSGKLGDDAFFRNKESEILKIRHEISQYTAAAAAAWKLKIDLGKVCYYGYGTDQRLKYYKGYLGHYRNSGSVSGGVEYRVGGDGFSVESYVDSGAPLNWEDSYNHFKISLYVILNEEEIAKLRSIEIVHNYGIYESYLGTRLTAN